MNIRAASVAFCATFLMVLSNLGPLLNRALKIESDDFFTRNVFNWFGSFLQPIDSTESVRVGVTMALWGFFGLLAWWVWQNVSEVTGMVARYKILAASSLQRGNAPQQRALRRSLLRGLGLRLVSLLMLVVIMALYLRLVIPVANALLARYVFLDGSPWWLGISLVFMLGVSYVAVMGLRVAWHFKHTETV